MSLTVSSSSTVSDTVADTLVDCVECVPSLKGHTHTQHTRGPTVSGEFRHGQPLSEEGAAVRVCTYCGGPAGTIDHIRPRQFGGTDDPDNLTDACQSCNSRKGTLPVELFRADWHTIRDYLLERGWTPTAPGRYGKTSSWRCPDPARRHVWFSRAAAIRAAAFDGLEEPDEAA